MEQEIQPQQSPISPVSPQTKKLKTGIIALTILILTITGASGYFVYLKIFKPAIEPVITIPGYPYILKPLSQNQLSDLRSEFEASNKGICTQINEYGLTEYRDGCYGESAGRAVDEASSVEIVKKWLIKNSKFDGITNEADVVVGGGDGIGCINCLDDKVAWSEKKYTILKFELPNQTYKNLPVEGDVSPIVVFTNADGISRVDGHWFPVITAPSEPRVSETSVKNKLNGRTLTYGDIGGKPINFRVKEGDLVNTANRVVFVKKSPQGLEFRLAWKISVGQSLSWTVYVDALTGEELKIIQRFATSN